MECAMPACPLREDRPRPGASLEANRPDEVPIHLDLLRADLYRLLDELVRARSRHHRDLVVEFERAWNRFKRETGEA